MCLITKQTKSTILTEDMIVYKKIMSIQEGLYSCLFNFQWELGKLYQTTIEESDEFTFHDRLSKHTMLRFCGMSENNIKTTHHSDLKDFLIENAAKCYGAGFHSATYKSRLKLFRRQYVYECTIPAGSEIYNDNTGLIISNQIIINKLCA